MSHCLASQTETRPTVHAVIFLLVSSLAQKFEESQRFRAFVLLSGPRCPMSCCGNRTQRASCAPAPRPSHPRGDPDPLPSLAPLLRSLDIAPNLRPPLPLHARVPRQGQGRGRSRPERRSNRVRTPFPVVGNFGFDFVRRSHTALESGIRFVAKAPEAQHPGPHPSAHIQI